MITGLDILIIICSLAAFWAIGWGIAHGSWLAVQYWFREKPIKNVEYWLLNNPEALASLKRGIADAEAGKLKNIDIGKLYKGK